MTPRLFRLTQATWLGVRVAVRVPRVVAGDGMNALLRDAADASRPLFTEVPAGGAHTLGGDDRRWPVARRAARASPPDRDASLATDIAFAFIRHLSRLPGARWRNSCLHRAAAECVILRSRGHPAVMRIGVVRSQPGALAAAPMAMTTEGGTLTHPAPEVAGAVVAHAWVECAGMHCQTARGGERDAYVLLERYT